MNKFFTVFAILCCFSAIHSQSRPVGTLSVITTIEIRPDGSGQQVSKQIYPPSFMVKTQCNTDGFTSSTEKEWQTQLSAIWKVDHCERLITYQFSNMEMLQTQIMYSNSSNKDPVSTSFEQLTFDKETFSLNFVYEFNPEKIPKNANIKAKLKRTIVLIAPKIVSNTGKEIAQFDSKSNKVTWSLPGNNQKYSYSFGAIGTFGSDLSDSKKSTEQQKTSPKNVDVTANSQKRENSPYTRTYDLDNYDSNQVKKFEALFLLRLYGILQQDKIEILNNAVDDWDTASIVYDKMAENARLFGESQKNHSSAFHSFFQNSENNLAATRELLQEINQFFKAKKRKPGKTAQEAQIVSPLLFKAIINLDQGPIIYPKSYQSQINQWKQKFISLIKENEININTLDAELTEFGINTSELLLDFDKNPVAAFKLPLRDDKEETITESDYIYRSFVEKANLPVSLSSYYSSSYLRYLNIFMVRISYNGLESMILLSRFTVQVIEYFFSDLFRDCLGKYAQSSLLTFYRDVLKLHNDIRFNLLENTDTIKELVILAQNNQPIANANKLRVQDLLTKANKYLEQRNKMDDLVAYLERITENAVKNTRNGSASIIDKDLENAVRFLRKVTVSSKTGTVVKGFKPGPCTSLQNKLS